jgi:glycosyltransferase involved in cell wall biosynthesis
MITPEISVIVPIYGVEKYIARCAESLFSQTMTENVEFLFVDDSTKDNSIQVLQHIISDKYYPPS